MLLILPVEAQAPARRCGHDRALVCEALDLARVRGDIEVVAPAGPGDPGARTVRGIGRPAGAAEPVVPVESRR